MKLSIQLRANDLAGLQYIGNQLNQMLQAANSIGDIVSQDTGPVGIGYTVDASGAVQDKIVALQTEVATLQASLPPVLVVVNPVPVTP